MDNINKETHKAFILWLSGACLDDIRTLTGMEGLIKSGALVELEPTPITGPQAQHYQVFSGRSPASFGFFDTLMPLGRLPRPQQGLDGYTVIEEHVGRDAAPKMLPDLLRAAGWAVEYVETTPVDLADCVQGLIQSEIEASQDICKIVKCSVETHNAADMASLGEAIQYALSWVGETGLLAVLSDIQSARVERFVNINNFLADMGLIERDEQGGQINWANSLAYYVGHGQLWVNLLGRDPQGAVYPQDEYEEVRETLIKALPTKLQDAGKQVIERVYRKEELYSSEYLFCAPDLVVVFKPGYAPSPRSTHLVFDKETFTLADTTAMAGISPSGAGGFLLASAPTLQVGISAPERAPLTAVVPTLLHALSIEYVDMDSSAVSTLFAPSFLETHPIRTDLKSQELSEEDEELVINRLRDLGYV